jgi:hypothetical protein
MILLLIACHAKLEAAPTEIEDLCAYLYENEEEPEPLGEGLTSLQSWLDTRTDDERGFNLPPLTEADVVDVERPEDRDLADAIGGVADAVSPWSLQQHVDFIMLADQSVVDPHDYAQFDREFLSGGDCFGARGCERTQTWNTIIKTAAFGIEIPYEYGKDYQWVDFPTADGGQRTAVVSRGWVPVPSFDESGDNGIWQSYTLDVFIGEPDGQVHRVQALWTETKLVIDDFVTEDYLRGELIDGLHDVFEDTDAAIGEAGL